MTYSDTKHKLKPILQKKKCHICVYNIAYGNLFTISAFESKK